jgi:ATP-dependent protease ClpP protease subunit
MANEEVFSSCRAIDARHAIVYLGGVISEFSPLLISQALARIERIAPRRKVLTVIIDMPKEFKGKKMGGGDFPASEMIVGHLLREKDRRKVKIRTVVYREAFSSGTWIFQVGDERWITSRSTLAFHLATLRLSPKAAPNRHTYQATANRLSTVDTKQLALITMKAGDIEMVVRFFENESRIGAKMARHIGLADKVIREPRDLNSLVRYLARRR